MHRRLICSSGGVALNEGPLYTYNTFAHIIWVIRIDQEVILRLVTRSHPVTSQETYQMLSLRDARRNYVRYDRDLSNAPSGVSRR